MNLLNGAASEAEKPVTRKPAPVYFCLFLLAVTMAAVLYEYYLLYSLSENKKAVYAELASVNAEVDSLNARISSAETRLKGTGEVLDFMLGGARAGEILSALAVRDAEDMILERLEIVPGGMALFGRAANERGVSELYRALVSSNIFSSVSKPRTIPEPGSGLSFAFQCEMAAPFDAGAADD